MSFWSRDDSKIRAAMAAWHEDRLSLRGGADPSTVVEFETNQWCRMPGGDPAKGGGAAFLRAIHIINAIRPGTFAEPDRLYTDDAGYGIEDYPDFRVIHPPHEGGTRTHRIVALRAADAVLLRVVADWVNAHSYYGDQP